MSPALDQAHMKEQIAAHWGVRAETLDVSDWHVAKSEREDRAWERVFRRHLPAGEQLRTLDLGTGLGYLAGVSAQLGHEAVGVDIAPRMIERARERADQLGLTINLRVADIDRLPFPDGYFDAITERNVIWTMPDPARTLAELRRVLRPGGHLLQMESKWLEQPTDHVHSAAGGAPNLDEHYREFRDSLPLMGGATARQLAAVVRENGYREIVVDYLRGVHAARIACKPEMERPRGRRPYLLRAIRP